MRPFANAGEPDTSKDAQNPTPVHLARPNVGSEAQLLERCPSKGI